MSCVRAPPGTAPHPPVTTVHGLGFVRPHSGVLPSVMSTVTNVTQGFALSRSGRRPARICSFSAASPWVSACITQCEALRYAASAYDARTAAYAICNQRGGGSHVPAVPARAPHTTVLNQGANRICSTHLEHRLRSRLGELPREEETVRTQQLRAPCVPLPWECSTARLSRPTPTVAFAPNPSNAHLCERPGMTSPDLAKLTVWCTCRRVASPPDDWRQRSSVSRARCRQLSCGGEPRCC